MARIKMVSTRKTLSQNGSRKEGLRVKDQRKENSPWGTGQGPGTLRKWSSFCLVRKPDTWIVGVAQQCGWPCGGWPRGKLWVSGRAGKQRIIGETQEKREKKKCRTVTEKGRKAKYPCEALAKNTPTNLANTSRGGKKEYYKKQKDPEGVASRSKNHNPKGVSRQKGEQRGEKKPRDSSTKTWSRHFFQNVTQ